jgi:hypothetical protein
LIIAISFFVISKLIFNIFVLFVYFFIDFEQDAFTKLLNLQIKVLFNILDDGSYIKYFINPSFNLLIELSFKVFNVFCLVFKQSFLLCSHLILQSVNLGFNFSLSKLLRFYFVERVPNFCY